MRTSAAVAMLSVAVVLVFCGWLFLFRTRHVLHLARHTHRTSPGWIQNWPGHRLIFKSWYPVYLRCGGILAWLLAACLISVALLNFLR